MTIYEKLYKQFGLSPSQQKIIELIGKHKKVLEIGSSSGYMTKQLKKNGCIVDALEIDAAAVKKVEKIARKVFNVSIEDKKVVDLTKEKYEFVTLADVLEHLVSPEVALGNLKKLCNERTIVIVSAPNIASWSMRKQLFFKGDFEYTETGLLDKTHLHFYTLNTLPEFLRKNGFNVLQIIGTITRLPLESKLLALPILKDIYKLYLRPVLVNKWKNLSYSHFVVVAKKA